MAGTAQPTVAVVAHATLDAATAAAIDALDKLAFAGHPLAGYSWAPAHFHALATLGEQLVGHADLTERVGLWGTQAVRLVGLGTVMTLPAYQRRGVAAAVLDACERFLLGPLQADYGVLFCTPATVPFYGQRGWQVLTTPVTVMQPAGAIIWPALTMALPRPGLALPLAPLDLRGYPW